MYVHNNSTYMMFLHERFFKRSIFKSLYDIVVKNLENRGITVVSINSMIEFQKYNDINKLSFNENLYPDCNVLYIHLFNGMYYADNIFAKKKTEKEREMLLLLAGKLGVKKITYSTEIIETSFDKLSSKIDVIDNSLGADVSKNTRKSNGISGSETYLNRGAPVYLLSENIQQVDENIKSRLGSMESNIFSYDFYKKNPKLEAFVYKRYEFKMQQLDYTIDVEDISDKSYEVKTFLMGCGVGFAYHNNTHTTEKINYTFEFFDDKELRLELFDFMRRSKDNFINVREVYDNASDKNLAINYICEFVVTEIEKYEFIDIDMTKFIKDKNDEGYVNLYKKFIEWKIKQSPGTFKGICSNFISSQQINEWIDNTLNDTNVKEFKRIEKYRNNYDYTYINKLQQRCIINNDTDNSYDSYSDNSNKSIDFIESDYSNQSTPKLSIKKEIKVNVVIENDVKENEIKNDVKENEIENDLKENEIENNVKENEIENNVKENEIENKVKENHVKHKPFRFRPSYSKIFINEMHTSPSSRLKGKLLSSRLKNVKLLKASKK